MRKRLIAYFKFCSILIVLVVFSVVVLRFFGAKAIQIILSKSEKTASSDVKSRFSANSYSAGGYEVDFLKFKSKTETPKSSTVENLEKAVSYTDSESVAVNLSAISGKYTNYNGTSVINNTDYEISELLNASYDKPDSPKDEPYILIYHTHTSESYMNGGTVVDIGRKMAEEFEKNGYKTIHLTESFDDKEFSGAYSRSAVSVQKILNKYPSIKLVFDVHRDAITDSAGVTYKPLTVIDGKNTAQVMFVCGTDSKGLKHPDWRENFKFALDVSRKMGEDYGALSRPVNLRKDRFNTHFTKYSFIIEMGSESNTLEEALNAAVLTVDSIISTIEK